MKPAEGFRWSRRRQRIEVFIHGQMIAWQSRSEAKDLQARGAFRHLVAEMLIRAGVSPEVAAGFACQKVRNAPYWMRLQNTLAIARANVRLSNKEGNAHEPESVG